MTGEELIRRRAENRCIRCGSQRVSLDPETGFVKRLCDSCEREDEQCAIQQRGGGRAQRQNRQRQAEENLDRWMSEA
jgi:hypothetical protein